MVSCVWSTKDEDFFHRKIRQRCNVNLHVCCACLKHAPLREIIPDGIRITPMSSRPPSFELQTRFRAAQPPETDDLAKKPDGERQGETEKSAYIYHHR